jgi:hypothetical protein
MQFSLFISIFLVHVHLELFVPSHSSLTYSELKPNNKYVIIDLLKATLEKQRSQVVK